MKTCIRHAATLIRGVGVQVGALSGQSDGLLVPRETFHVNATHDQTVRIARSANQPIGETHLHRLNATVHSTASALELVGLELVVKVFGRRSIPSLREGRLGQELLDALAVVENLIFAGIVPISSFRDIGFRELSVQIVLKAVELGDALFFGAKVQRITRLAPRMPGLGKRNLCFRAMGTRAHYQSLVHTRSAEAVVRTLSMLLFVRMLVFAVLVSAASAVALTELDVGARWIDGLWIGHWSPGIHVAGLVDAESDRQHRTIKGEENLLLLGKGLVTLEAPFNVVLWVWFELVMKASVDTLCPVVELVKCTNRVTQSGLMTP